MSIRRISLLLAIALTLILSSFRVNAQQPRSVPNNDNIINAKTIKIGKNYSVPDIGAASNEVGEPTATCRAGSVIPHTVWYTFTQPVGSYVSLSTFGSLLSTPQVTTMDTMLAVYELTGPSKFTERACVDDVNGITAAQLVFIATAGKTYYIAVGTFGTGPFLEASTLKLNTRMLSTLFFPLNHDFETAISNPGWTVKNGNDDQITCANASYPAYVGSCTFRFIGTPGVTTKLVQTLPFPTYFAPRKNALLSATLYFRVMDTLSLGATKIKYVVSYSDGTLPSIQTINLTGAVPLGGYDIIMTPIALKSSKVASIKLEVRFGASTGSLLFDYPSYFYGADPATRGSGLLPVPTPAAN
jgi:hypothetical protein